MIPRRNTLKVSTRRVDGAKLTEQQDHLAVEEPLEIRLSHDGKSQSVSVTMRTPGDDYELAAGFLFSEGIIRSGSDIHQITYCVGSDKTKQVYNAVSGSLKPGVKVDSERLLRHFYTSSSCGVCGKASIDAVKAMLPERGEAHPSPYPLPQGEGKLQKISREVITSLPKKLADEQAVFEKTGGLHAAGLFDLDGKLICLKEDVGRHNAVDKTIGAQVLAGKMPLDKHILLVSGRASFELMQKTIMAGIPILAAVGAPSSLAVSVAQEFGVTLIGFLRGERFNIYSGAERIAH